MASTAATLAFIAILPVAPLVKVFTVLAAGLSAVDAFGAIAWHRGPRSVRAFALREREIEVEEAGGRTIEGGVRDGSVVSPWLTIVRWRPRGARRDRTIVVLPDMLDAEAFRAVRVALKAG